MVNVLQCIAVCEEEEHFPRKKELGKKKDKKEKKDKGYKMFEEEDSEEELFVEDTRYVSSFSHHIFRISRNSSFFCIVIVTRHW